MDRLWSPWRYDYINAGSSKTEAEPAACIFCSLQEDPGDDEHKLILLAQPETHIFLKPNVTRAAAQEYGFDFQYRSRPSWETYANLLEFADLIRRDLPDLKPRDMIDIQSFIWVQGSDEYEE